MKNNAKYILIVGTTLAIIFYAWLRYENSQYIWEPRTGFGDTHEFLGSAAEPLLSKEFWVSLRPPVVPLVYKMLEEDIDKIFQFQLWFSIVAWSLLGLAVFNVIRSKLLKIIAFLCVIAFSLSEEIIMWDYVIIGESISISISALFIAAALLLLSKWSRFHLFILFTAATLFAFVRDDFAYYILMCSIVILVFLLRTKNWKRPLVVSLFFLGLFFGGNTLSAQSLRWYRPLLNTIGMRILPNSEYLSYFENKGMPVNDALLERSGKYLHADDIAMIKDPRLKEFRKWVQKNGYREYLNFLWFFKADTLQKFFDDANLVFSPDVYYYTATRFRGIILDSRLDEILFPMRYSFMFFLSATMISSACVVVALYEKKSTWIVPLSLNLLTYPQALIIWNADAYELSRHVIYLNIMLRIGWWILVFFVLDFVLERTWPLINRKS